MPRQRRGIRGDAPQGYLFRFAPLRGHRPLRTVCRKRMRIPPVGAEPRPYNRFPSGKCIIKTKPAAKGRHLPLPLRGKGAI